MLPNSGMSQKHPPSSRKQAPTKSKPKPLEQEVRELISVAARTGGILLGIGVKLLKITAKAVVAGTETYEKELTEALSRSERKATSPA